MNRQVIFVTLGWLIASCSGSVDRGPSVTPSPPDTTADAGSDAMEIDGGTPDPVSPPPPPSPPPPCIPGEVVGEVQITNTCYLDCFNACMSCSEPTGDATCRSYFHAGHAPYCPSMSFIECPEGSVAERVSMEGQYFPGTAHYANEVYACLRVCPEPNQPPLD